MPPRANAGQAPQRHHGVGIPLSTQLNMDNVCRPAAERAARGPVVRTPDRPAVNPSQFEPDLQVPPSSCDQGAKVTPTSGRTAGEALTLLSDAFLDFPTVVTAPRYKRKPRRFSRRARRPRRERDYLRALEHQARGSLARLPVATPEQLAEAARVRLCSCLTRSPLCRAWKRTPWLGEIPRPVKCGVTGDPGHRVQQTLKPVQVFQPSPQQLSLQTGISDAPHVGLRGRPALGLADIPNRLATAQAVQAAVCALSVCIAMIYNVHATTEQKEQDVDEVIEQDVLKFVDDFMDKFVDAVADEVVEEALMEEAPAAETWQRLEHFQREYAAYEESRRREHAEDVCILGGDESLDVEKWVGEFQTDCAADWQHMFATELELAAEWMLAGLAVDLIEDATAFCDLAQRRWCEVLEEDAEAESMPFYERTYITTEDALAFADQVDFWSRILRLRRKERSWFQHLGCECCPSTPAPPCGTLHSDDAHGDTRLLRGGIRLLSAAGDVRLLHYSTRRAFLYFYP